jgi:hypothetical protein
MGNHDREGNSMAVKSNINGTYTISTKADVVKALKMMQERKEEAESLMREHGIQELMQEATELKKAATAYCVAKGISNVDMGDSYAQLREDGYDRRWIGTRAELAEMDAPEGAVPLRTILQRKFGGKSDTFKETWNRITKRVIDKDSLQEVIDEGVLDEDEIAPAFVEKKKAPYLRVYDKS